MNTIYKAKERCVIFDRTLNRLVTYEKGTELKNVTSEDLNELLSKDLVEAVLEPKTVYLTEKEIMKMKTKTELLNYCKKIGLTDIDRNLTLDKIRAAILEYITNMTSEEPKETTENEQV